MTSHGKVPDTVRTAAQSAAERTVEEVRAARAPYQCHTQRIAFLAYMFATLSASLVHGGLKLPVVLRKSLADAVLSGA
eukprot:1739811-Amphidinium_carterae.1